MLQRVYKHATTDIGDPSPRQALLLSMVSLQMGLDLRRDEGIAARLADSDAILGIIVEDVVHLRLKAAAHLFGISCSGDALARRGGGGGDG